MVKLSSGIVLNPNELTSEDREAIVKALEETKSGVWKPGMQETYWLSTGFSGVTSQIWSEDSTDMFRLSTGQVFPTREAAEKYLTYLKALQVLRGDTKGYEWNLGERWYTAYYDDRMEDIRTMSSTDAYEATLKFSSAKEVTDSINAHEKEWHIVLLGVE